MNAREQARFDSVERMGEWKTATHVERQASKKETPAKPASTP